MERESLKPIDICLGNFIDCFGKVEMVAGLIPREGGNWFICHKAWNQKENPIPDGVEFDSYGVPLTEQWKECMGVEKYKFPEWIKYVHEVQNYLRWYCNVNILETFNWHLFSEYRLANIETVTP